MNANAKTFERDGITAEEAKEIADGVNKERKELTRQRGLTIFRSKILPEIFAKAQDGQYGLVLKLVDDGHAGLTKGEANDVVHNGVLRDLGYCYKFVDPNKIYIQWN